MPRSLALSPGRPALTGVLVLSAVAVVGIAIAILWQADGWHYYTTPMRVRAYHAAHRALRPSGTTGQALGIAGLAMMTVPILYAIRKRWSKASRLGGMKGWLDVHIFCGTVGPVLVTFHSAMKFNGVISVAYWSMVAVMLSGFVGRYLYVRIPRSLRGAELSYAEIEARAAGMLAEVAAAGVSVSEVSSLRGGRGLLGRRERSQAHRRLVEQGLDPGRAAHVVRLAAERALLLRRLAQLSRTRRLFAYWHVFHLPLVYVMFAIAFVHIALAVYLGYGSFLQR
jgi:hypothetical protein